MRRTFIAAALLTTLVLPAHAADSNTYSEGYRMGQLSKWSIKGLFSKTGEGELLVGNESGPLYTSDDEGNRIQINPWAFSSDQETYNRFKGMIGEYVVIRYRQLQINLTSVNGDTDYRVVDVKPVGGPKPDACSDPTATGGAKSDGDRVGRIVKASTKGTLSKSYEVTIQEGNSGSKFIHMSILSDAMYACALRYLTSGAKVKVTYNETFLRNMLARDSNYAIVALTPIKGLE